MKPVLGSGGKFLLDAMIAFFRLFLVHRILHLIKSQQPSTLYEDDPWPGLCYPCILESHAELLAMNMWGAGLWILSSYVLFKKRVFFAL